MLALERSPSRQYHRYESRIPSSGVIGMATRVFKIDKIAAEIAAYLLAINPISTVALALTGLDLEVPALRALWETRGSFKDLITEVLSTDEWCLVFPNDTDLCLYVSLLPSSSRHPAYSSITENPKGIAATAHYTGAGQTQAIRLVDAPTSRARVGHFGGIYATCDSCFGWNPSGLTVSFAKVGLVAQRNHGPIPPPLPVTAFDEDHNHGECCTSVWRVG